MHGDMAIRGGGACMVTWQSGEGEGCMHGDMADRVCVARPGMIHF